LVISRIWARRKIKDRKNKFKRKGGINSLNMYLLIMELIFIIRNPFCDVYTIIKKDTNHTINPFGVKVLSFITSKKNHDG
jgi:hypothetical protein